ncbi:MAG: WXG100 family type VII secretion target [Lachnospiraceae bacterium]|nr:WXG100 family type VII secretion target [Lachnospiraceae bacterium]
MIFIAEGFFHRNAVKVDMGVLRAKAGEVETKVKDMKIQLDEVDQMIRDTMSHWKGEAGDLHRNIYNAKKADIDTMVKALAEHPQNLRKAADIYDGLVGSTSATIGGLPSDVIS